MGGRALRCSGEETGGLVLKPDSWRAPEGGPCRPSGRAQWSRWGPLEAEFVPQRSLLVGVRYGLGRKEGSRRCVVVGERESVAAAVDYEEYWSLRLNERGCLMCSPEKYKSLSVRTNYYCNPLYLYNSLFALGFT